MLLSSDVHISVFAFINSFLFMKYRWWPAVTLEGTETRYAPSGTPLTFYGRIHTDRHLASQDPPYFIS